MRGMESKTLQNTTFFIVCVSVQENSPPKISEDASGEPQPSTSGLLASVKTPEEPKFTQKPSDQSPRKPLDKALVTEPEPPDQAQVPTVPASIEEQQKQDHGQLLLFIHAFFFT